MATNGKIKHLEFVKEWSGQYGAMFKFKVEMEDGEKGEMNVKTMEGIKIGDEFEYTTKETDYGKVIVKVQKEGGKKFGGKGSYQQEDPVVKFIGFAMGYAKDIAVARPQPMKDTLADADSMFNWMKTKYDEYQKSKPVQTTTTSSEQHEQPKQPLSEAQIKYIQTLWSNMKLENSDEKRKEYLKKHYNVESTKDLHKDDASKLIEELLKPNFKEVNYGSSPDDDLPF